MSREHFKVTTRKGGYNSHGVEFVVGVPPGGWTLPAFLLPFALEGSDVDLGHMSEC